MTGLALAGCGTLGAARSGSLTITSGVNQAATEISHLNSEISIVSRDSASLKEDVESLKENLGNVVADLVTAKSDLRQAQSLISTRPAPTHTAICKSVNIVRIDAKNVDNDDQFVAGFISGLHNTDANLKTQESRLRLSANLVRDLSTATLTSISGPVPTSTQMEVSLTQASRAQTLAASTSSSTIASMSTDLRKMHSALNVLVSQTGCGAKINASNPFAPVPGRESPS